jgi:hypothetical protein
MLIGRKPLGNFFWPRFFQPLVMKIASKNLSYVPLVMEYSHDEGTKKLIFFEIFLCIRVANKGFSRIFFMNKGPCSWKNIPKSSCYVTFGNEIFQWQGSNTLEVLEYLDAQKYKAGACKEYFFMCKEGSMTLWSFCHGGLKQNLT